MNISLQNTININNNFYHPKSSYNNCFTNVSFRSEEPKDVFIPNLNDPKIYVHKLEKQEKLLQNLIEKLFNPNAKDLANPEALNLENIGLVIKEITGKNFKPTLNSIKTVEILLKSTLTEEDVKARFRINKRKSLDSEVCSGLKAKIFYEEINKVKISELNSAFAKFKKLEKENIGTITGRIYEYIAANEVNRIIIPAIAKKLAAEEQCANPKDIEKQLHQIRNYGFGNRLIEIDHIIVRNKPDNTNKATEVVGIVETKSSQNRLYKGFNRRIENLKWLKEEFISSKYKDPETNTDYLFTSDSFKRFSTDINEKKAYENIYLITTNDTLVDLDRKILSRFKQGFGVQGFKNVIDENLKTVLKSYSEYGLQKNIIFTPDILGYKFIELVQYFVYKNIIKTETNPFHYFRFLEKKL